MALIAINGEKEFVYLKVFVVVTINIRQELYKIKTVQ